MSKLTDAEAKILEKYEKAENEERAELHEEIKLDVITEHKRKFGLEQLKFYGLLDESKNKTFLVKDCLLLYNVDKCFFLILQIDFGLFSL